MDHSYMHPGLRCFGEGFIVFAQPTTPAQPGQRSFNNPPPPGQHLKPVAVLRTPDNTQPVRASTQATSWPAYPASAQISLRRGKPPYQFADNQLCPIPDMNVSRVDYHCQEQPQGIHHDMSFAPPHLSCQRRSREAPFFRSLDRLAIYDGCAGSGVPPFCLPHLGP